MIRAEGWEARLAEALREASARPFDARRWNCAIFAWTVAQAVSGREIPFRRKRAGIEASVDAVLPRVEPLRALRGDIVLAHTPGASLGVCTGRVAAFVTRSGLLTIPMRQVAAAWSV